MYSEYIGAHWRDVRSKLLETIDKLTDADLGYRPFEGAYSVRELILHIAHEEQGEVGYGITGALDAWPDAFDPAQYAGLGELRAVLSQVHERSAAVFVDLTDADLAREMKTPWGAKGSMLELLGHVIEHEVHHRAELSLILGLMGREGLDA